MSENFEKITDARTAKEKTGQAQENRSKQVKQVKYVNRHAVIARQCISKKIKLSQKDTFRKKWPSVTNKTDHLNRTNRESARNLHRASISEFGDDPTHAGIPEAPPRIRLIAHVS